MKPDGTSKILLFYFILFFVSEILGRKGNLLRMAFFLFMQKENRKGKKEAYLNWLYLLLLSVPPIKTEKEEKNREKREEEINI
jgi:hypothetical protein